MKRVTILILFTLVFSTFTCKGKHQSARINEVDLHSAFRVLYLSHFGLEFPPDESRLASCNGACLQVFDQVMDAKSYLTTQVRSDPDLVTELTLNSIFHFGALVSESSTKQASSNERVLDTNTSTCYGAIIALYFLNSDIQDKAIVDRMKTAPLDIVERLFDLDYEWHYNRPNPDRWIAFVASLPEAKFSVPFRNATMDAFRQVGHKKFGVMLDRSMAPKR